MLLWLSSLVFITTWVAQSDWGLLFRTTTWTISFVLNILFCMLKWQLFTHVKHLFSYCKAASFCETVICVTEKTRCSTAVILFLIRQSRMVFSWDIVLPLWSDLRLLWEYYSHNTYIWLILDELGRCIIYHTSYFFIVYGILYALWCVIPPVCLINNSCS